MTLWLDLQCLADGLLLDLSAVAGVLWLYLPAVADGLLLYLQTVEEKVTDVSLLVFLTKVTT